MTRTVRFVIPATFLKEARDVFGDEHIAAMKAKLAVQPDLGDLIPKTGGARKIWQFGRGGQSRCIYYYHQGDSEIFFLACYPKNRKKDLSEDEKRELHETIKLIKSARKKMSQ